MTSTYKIYDTFCYNGETIALFHIEYLYNTVDKFIIVESRETHSGNIKPFLYFEQNATLFAPYMDKIHYLIIDTFSSLKETFENWKPEIWMTQISYESWCREQYQRNYAMNYLKEQPGPYYVYCGDVDEIPNREILQNFKNDFAGDYTYRNITDAIYLEMKFFYYNFNWKKVYNWYHAYITSDQCLKTYSLNDLRLFSNKMKYISNGGWHCSYFQSYEDIKRKCESFAHREFNHECYKTIEHINNCLLNGTDLFNRGEFEDLKEFTDSRYLPEGFEKIQAIILELQQIHN
jgi:hypothetical protein